jgi:predicted dienelactone hydrolase
MNMNRKKLLGWVGIAMLSLAACSPPAASPAALPQATATMSQASKTAIQITATIPQATKEANLFPLSEPGPYQVGFRTLALTDAGRENRAVGVTVWYPVKPLADATNVDPNRDAEPDCSGAPYPLILSSTKVANIFAPIVVSHGFTWASVDQIDSYMMMNKEMIDQPLDILFAFHQMADHPPQGLEGVMDVDHAGAIGYSFDGYNTLAMSGARIDPKYYLSQCPTPDATTEAILGGFSAFSCAPAREWDKFVAHAGASITSSEDGLWQPLTDKRIRAVMPMAGEGWWLFGEKGLAAVDRPVLIIVSTNDELYKENALIFEHLGTSEKSLISFVGQDHMMIYGGEMIARMTHFAVAFFGYHLQGNPDLAQYFSEDFVARHADLAWGIYTED